MTESLYAQAARTRGLPHMDGPNRRGLLHQAAAEASQAAMPHLDENQKRLLAQTLLPPKKLNKEVRDRLLANAITLWCEAHWDGAAPKPRDDMAASLLESIAADRLKMSHPRAKPPWISWAGPLCILVALAVSFGVLQHKDAQRREERQARLRAAALATQAEMKRPFLPAPPPIYLPDPMAGIDRELADQFRRDQERSEQRQMMEDILRLRADLDTERRLREIDRRQYER